jgi:hypothetical protein
MSTTAPSAACLRGLLAAAIDYAGLFPPASLTMSAALRNYADYRRGAHGWALGTFVLPAARLEEFRASAQELIGEQGGASAGTFPLSVVLSSNLAAELAAVRALQNEYGNEALASIEARISQPEEIAFLARHAPAETKLFFEIAPERSGELLPAIQRSGGCAKLRMGGTVAEVFPCADTVAAFLTHCAELRLPLKATAGLHHPLRCTAPLTYEPNAAKTTMYGFLNFLTAAAIAWQQREACSGERGTTLLSTLSTCLYDTDVAHWQFSEEALTWTGGPEPVSIDCDALRDVRAHFALSFGSCSFEEPIGELQSLELL